MLYNNIINLQYRGVSELMKIKNLLSIFTAAALSLTIYCVSAEDVTPDYIYVYNSDMLVTSELRTGADEVTGISYDSSANILTLKDCEISEPISGFEAMCAIGVMGSENSSLTVNLVGDNKITDNGAMDYAVFTDNCNITFTGEGSLDVSAATAVFGTSGSGSFKVAPTSENIEITFDGAVKTASADSPYTFTADELDSVKSIKITKSSSSVNDDITDAALPSDAGKDVTATYQSGTKSGTVYSVDITWGSLEYTYTDKGEGSWDTSKHQYTGTTEASWSCESGADKVTLKNHSNADLNVSVDFTPSLEYSNISGSFTDGSGNRINGKLSLANAENTAYDDPPTASAQLALSGTLEKNAKNQKIGKVTLKFSKA